MTQQVIHGTYHGDATASEQCHLSPVQRKILFLSFTVSHLFKQKKHMQHHQQGAMVASCGGTSVHGMQATVII